MSNCILVTGGAGYIGSHACVELLQAGYAVVVVDNLSNSKREVLTRIARITGQNVPFYRVDIRDRAALTEVFQQHPISAVMHFAGLKAVGESCAEPLRYYDNNVHGSLVLFDTMAQAGVTTLVFSSSATVYGAAPSVCYREEFPFAPTNPYGQTKAMIECILRDLCAADTVKPTPATTPWRVVALRYFNPIGAHDSGLIGEDPHGIPNNLMPYIAQVAAGKLPQLSVFGNDYPTPDGTGRRDYIHVVDLIHGHIAALRALQTGTLHGYHAFNLGTGQSYSVLEMIEAFQRVTGRTIPYRIAARRPGDLPEYYADPTRAAQVLGWRAQKNLDDMMRDTWRWQSNNPEGYG